MSIALQDVAGNFLAATKLSAGTLQRGTNLLYSVNGGAQASSQSNTITAASSGIAGLSVTALRGGTTTVTVGSDTASVKTALSDFITEYNKVQSLITTDTVSSTDAKGNVTAGVLAGDRDITTLAWQLRNSVYSPISGLSGSIDQLAALGYATNGNDNTIALSGSTTLDSMLANNLSSIEDLFSNATKGLAVTLSSYLDKMAGDNGSLVAHQDLLTKQSTDLDAQIAAQESLVQAQRQRLINTFTAMETAQARINQQLTFLSQQTWGSSSTGK
jgi:flagellar hook-associated protein 2